MNYRIFGKTNWKVSEIGLGTWALGADWGQVSESDAIEVLEKAIENGVNFFDTADVYGDGRSEQLIGKVLKARSQKVYVATKFGRRLNPHVNSGYTKDNLERLSPLGDYPQKLKLANIYQDIEKTKKKTDAVNTWFEKNGLTAPPIPTELEWEVMKTSYAQVVKENTQKRLSRITDKFSTEGGKKEDFNGAIYVLADEMRHRKVLGEFGTYAEAYRYAEKYITINGNPVTAKQLQNTYSTTKSSSPLLDD